MKQTKTLKSKSLTKVSKQTSGNRSIITNNSKK